MQEMHIYLLIVTVSILLEGFFSGTEIALVSYNRLRLKRKARCGTRWAQKAYALVQRPEILFSTTLFGTNLCVITTTTVITLAVISRLGIEYEWVALFITSPLILLFGELVPKTIFQRYARTLMPVFIHPVVFARYLFFPVSLLMSAWSRLISKIYHARTSVQTHVSKDDIRNLLERTKKDIKIKAQERNMIRNILDFGHQKVEHVYIHLNDVVAMDQDATIEEVVEKFTCHRHTRMPVYKDNINNIIGTISQNSLFSLKGDIKGISSIVKPAFFVPESQPIDDLFYYMQKEAIQMAIVVNEFGVTVGIVTLEDLVEEVVGEISDEYDTREPENIEQTNSNTFVVQGRTEIDEVNEKLAVAIPKGNYVTVSGFLLEKFGRIPDAGDEIEHDNLRFNIRQASEKQILLVQITVI